MTFDGEASLGHALGGRPNGFSAYRQTRAKDFVRSPKFLGNWIMVTDAEEQRRRRLWRTTDSPRIQTLTAYGILWVESF